MGHSAALTLGVDSHKFTAKFSIANQFKSHTKIKTFSHDSQVRVVAPKCADFTVCRYLLSTPKSWYQEDKLTQLPRWI